MTTYCHIDHLDNGNFLVRVTELIINENGELVNGAELLRFEFAPNYDSRVRPRLQAEAEARRRLGANIR